MKLGDRVVFYDREGPGPTGRLAARDGVFRGWAIAEVIALIEPAGGGELRWIASIALDPPRTTTTDPKRNP